MAKKLRIKTGNGVSAKSSLKLKADSPPDYDSKPPIFSLERLQAGKYCHSGLDKDHKAAFSDAIFKRKSTSWRELKSCQRGGLGFEKIAKNSINEKLPTFLTQEEDNLLAFRFKGKAPMVGYRVKDVFYVLWFDRDFTLYNHG
jgi:hypothetical protein